MRKLPITASQGWNPATTGISELLEESPVEVKEEKRKNSVQKNRSFIYNKGNINEV